MILQLWKDSRALTVTAAVMLAAFALSLMGLLIDPRSIGGMPAWLKPAKFAISSAIFAASIAWIFRYLPAAERMKRWVGPGLAAILLLENLIIDFQAARGKTSHFNVGTVEDSVLYGVMGVSIGILWVLSVWISVALFRQKFADPVWGWALRLGMLITVLGSASGGLMTTPNAEQRAAIRQHHQPLTVGAHTVGAPDGGAGLAGVGWSTQHGDLRIPHFLGLHGLQIIPLLVWLRQRKSTTRFVFAISGAYAALFLILNWQALRGESLVEPSRLTLTILGVWLVATVVGTLVSSERSGVRMDAVHES